MRRWVLLIIFLCLSAGALALAQVYHFHFPIDEVFDAHKSAPKAEVPASVAKAPAEGSATEGEAGSTSINTQETAKGSKGQSAGGTGLDRDGVSLDLAQISTSGSTSVFAGRAAPGASVSVMENGVAVATTQANANGDWSLATDHKFAGPEPKFSLRTGVAEAQNNAAVGGKPLPSPSAGVTAEAAAEKRETTKPSPSVALLKDFEKVVASAREDSEKAGSAGTEVAAPAAAQGAQPAVPAEDAPSAEVSVLAPSPESDRDAGQSPSATIPVPMTFVFDEATLTPEGEKTAKLLLDYVRLKKFKSIDLTGHADERGTDAYNMELSRKRLDTVAAYLRSGGYDGALNLVPEGSTHPFLGIDRSKFSRDELMQLDRRVELRNAM